MVCLVFFIRFPLGLRVVSNAFLKDAKMPDLTLCEPESTKRTFQHWAICLHARDAVADSYQWDQQGSCGKDTTKRTSAVLLVSYLYFQNRSRN